jgi:hypothetical protein
MPQTQGGAFADEPLIVFVEIAKGVVGRDEELETLRASFRRPVSREPPDSFEIRAVSFTYDTS